MMSIFPFIAASYVSKLLIYPTTPKLKSARTLLIVSGVLSIISLLLVIMLMILVFIKKFSKRIAIISIAFLIIWVFIIQIIAGIATTNITSGIGSTTGVSKSSAILSGFTVGFSGLLILGLIIYIIILILRHPKHETLKHNLAETFSPITGIFSKSKAVQNAGNKTAVQTAALATKYGQTHQQAQLESKLASNTAKSIIQELESRGATAPQLEAATTAIVPYISELAIIGTPQNQMYPLGLNKAENALNPKTIKTSIALTPENFPPPNTSNQLNPTASQPLLTK